MAFVCERISNEDRQYFNSIGFTALNGRPKQSRWWAIDRERNFILTSRGGVIGEPWMGYQLYFENEFNDIEAIKYSEGNSFENTAIIKWSILKIEVPKSLLQKGYSVGDIETVVEEAFGGWGSPGLKPSQVLQVVVELKTEVKCKE